MILKKTPEQIDRMLQAGQALAEVIAQLASYVVPGVSSLELDGKAERLIRERGAVPSFLGYRGFPGSVCASPNQVIVHGIPGPARLRAGDLLSLDVGLILDGWHADSAYTYPVGAISPTAQRLLDVTRASLDAGIEQVRPGNHLTDISHAVQRVVEQGGFSVVREFVGHGIGRELHEDPQIPNFGPPGRGPVMEPGMVFAIEPMVNVGGWRTRTLEDDWTVVTADGSLSAHFEHSVAVTPSGPLVLTRLPAASSVGA
ncbi:MAG: type I methionyl aminopeptidase [Actinomycetota bacterium]